MQSLSRGTVRLASRAGLSLEASMAALDRDSASLEGRLRVMSSSNRRQAIQSFIDRIEDGYYGWKEQVLGEAYNSAAKLSALAGLELRRYCTKGWGFYLREAEEQRHN